MREIRNNLFRISVKICSIRAYPCAIYFPLNPEKSTISQRIQQPFSSNGQVLQDYQSMLASGKEVSLSGQEEEKGLCEARFQRSRGVREAEFGL